MAHFAELNSNNVVIRIVVACNQDIANNGGELSEQAAEHFKTVCPFSENGVKWIQTSYNNNFRKQYAVIGGIYDVNKDKFIEPQPFASWSLDSNDDWQAPIAYPTITTYGNNVSYIIYWDEAGQRWIGKDDQNNEFSWIPLSSSWVATGN
jgi:hypothetical protein